MCVYVCWRVGLQRCYSIVRLDVQDNLIEDVSVFEGAWGYPHKELLHIIQYMLLMRSDLSYCISVLPFYSTLATYTD